MKGVIVTKDPVVLKGYQSILKLSEYRKYNLAAILPDDIIANLEEGRKELIAEQKSKLKNPRRCTIKPEPWMETGKGQTQAKFAWKEGKEPPILDTDCNPITDTELPLDVGSKVKLAFTQSGYTLGDGETIGTRLSLLGIQVNELDLSGIDVGDLAPSQIAALFGKTDGYKFPKVSSDEPKS